MKVDVVSEKHDDDGDQGEERAHDRIGEELRVGRCRESGGVATVRSGSSILTRPQQFARSPLGVPGISTPATGWSVIRTVPVLWNPLGFTPSGPP